ncbi:hypothetical protein HMPREF9498_00484 [Enterococcus faecalis TX4248]|uniref:HTH merR-type domain-containing protein n=2 Tax=Enterococcus faecalis TaxID=1351 RepID=A0A125W9D4_ENTFL|nr:hypothetical protein HMPREF9498_00484 [Enterococcus faecalis TX4248]
MEQVDAICKKFKKSCRLLRCWHGRTFKNKRRLEGGIKMEVILTPENEASLRDFVHGIIVDEIEKARRDTSIDKRVLNQTEIAKYFDVSTTTIREWEKLGLPHGSVSKQGKFYDKEECRRWLLSQKR